MRDLVTIHAYKTEWCNRFSIVKAELAMLLGSTATSIRHIGSTSVLGLDAKDCIDVQVSVAEISEETRSDIEKKLTPAGFGIPEHSADHLPPWSTQDKVWKKIYLGGGCPNWEFAVNIHFRSTKYPNHDYAILFRDYLRDNDEAAVAYARLKVALSNHLGTNRDAYCEIKDHACDLIMIDARTWRKTADWSVPPT